MRKVLLGSLAVIGLGFPGSAVAADMAAPPVYKAPPLVAAPFSWTGFYIGGDVGGAWASQDVGSIGCPTCDQAPVSSSLNGSSVIGGVYGGYNWQLAPNFVIGAEGDFSWTGLNDSATAPNLFANGLPVGSGAVDWTRDTKWLASARARLGFTPAPNALLYVTGGAAWSGSNFTALDAFLNGCNNCGGTSFSQTKTGYAVGGGVDWAPWSNNWIFRAEYLYYHFDGATATANFVGSTALAATFNWGDLSIQEARVGVSYKF